MLSRSFAQLLVSQVANEEYTFQTHPSREDSPMDCGDPC